VHVTFDSAHGLQARPTVPARQFITQPQTPLLNAIRVAVGLMTA
jgi:hypothetical protein